MTMIASVGPDIPLELLTATGRYVGPLGWNIDRDFPVASQWLESKFPRWAVSIAEDWATGAFDHLDTVVFSRGDDSAQRLYYYLCELRGRGLVAGPEPVIFDVARIGRPSSEARCVDSVRALAARLGVGDAALEAAIAARAFPEVRFAKGGRVCLLGGTPPPDDRLHVAIGAVGWRFEGATLAETWLSGGPGAEAGTGDPCAALGQRLHAALGGPRGFHDRAADAVAHALAIEARAAVLWYAEEDEAEIWHLPAQRAALQAAGLPVLTLSRRDWRANDGATDEIAAFLTGLAS